MTPSSSTLRPVLCVRTPRVLLLSTALAVSVANGAGVASAQVDPYDTFAAFADTAFVASADSLVLQRFGPTLEAPSSRWEHVSETSVAVGFSTNLPARSNIVYGVNSPYEAATVPTDRRYHQHLHHLVGLTPGVTYQYRAILQSEDGGVIFGPIWTVTPQTVPGAIRIPDDLAGPPYVLDTPNATYLVTSDLEAPGTVFEVAADSVVLDLGGRTVTYNTEEAVIGPIGWWEYVGVAGFGVRSMKRNGVQVYNGTVVQGAGGNAAHRDASAGFNPMFFREGADVEVAGVVLDYVGSQMCGIYLSYPGPRNRIHHNVFLDRGTEVPNRHGLGSMSLALIGVVGNVEVHHNLIKRTRQNALDGGLIHDNEIYVDSYVTNSSGIISLSNDREGYGNKIFGTGYHVYGIGWGRNNWWHDNFVHLVGQGPDFRYDEYGNQESLNGIRLTQYAGATADYSGSIVEDNLVLITGGDCATDGACTSARGLQYHSDPYVVDNVIRGNTIKVVMAEGITRAAAVVTQGSPDRCGTEAPLHYVGNRLLSNVANVRMGDDSLAGCNHIFHGNQFVRVGNRSDYRTFVFGSYWLTTDHFFFDSSFEDGASANLVTFRTATQEISVGWTLAASVTDGSHPVIGADVTMVDDAGITIASGPTDADGRFAAELVQYDESSAGRTYHTPILVRATYGALADSASVSLDAAVEVSLVLAGPTSAPAVGTHGGLRMSVFPSVSSGSSHFRLAPGPDAAGVLVVHDLRGRIMRRIAIPRGTVDVAWDGRDDQGRSLGAGVYLARASVGGETAHCRVVIVR